MKRVIRKYFLEVIFVSSFIMIGLAWSLFTQNQFLYHTIDDKTIAYNTFDTADLLPKTNFDIEITIRYLKG